MKKSKPIIAWGGFNSRGKLAVDNGVEFLEHGRVTFYTLYLTKKRAKLLYKDVRKVEIREVG